MKRISVAVCILLIVTTVGCGKNPVDLPVEVAKKFPEPTWKADETGKYPATMTAVVTLPATLAGNAADTDILAAFVNQECRGVGGIVKYNNQNLFFVLIQGLPDEANQITFKYYSKKTAYMYESQAAVAFLTDAVYGSAENPKTLELQQLK